METLVYASLVLCSCWIVYGDSGTDAIELAKVVNRLQAQVLALQEARAQDQATILILEEKLHKIHGHLDPTEVSVEENDRLDEEKMKHRIHMGSRAMRMMDKEHHSLATLDGELRRLKRDLAEMVTVKEREIAATGAMGDIRLESDSLRVEIQKLRQEVESVRSRHEEDLASLNQIRSTQVTMKWLQRTVEEIRREMNEMATVVNVSVALRERQMVDANMTLMRSDLTSTRKEIGGFKVQQEREAAAMAQLQEDIVELRKRLQELSVNHQRLEEENNSYKEDLLNWQIKSVSKRSPHETLSFKKKFPGFLSKHFNSRKRRSNAQLNDIEGDKHRIRHHRQLKNEVIMLENSFIEMSDYQERMEKEVKRLRMDYGYLNATVRHLEQQSNHISNRTVRWVGDHNVLVGQVSELQERVQKVEHQTHEISKGINNVTECATGGIGKLHSSTVKLFEAMESMENKYDKSVADLQKEMSKMEFNVAQMQSSVDVLREEQYSQAQNLNPLKKHVITLQLETKRDRYRLLTLQNELINKTLQACKKENREASEELKLSVLESRIHSLNAEIHGKRKQVGDMYREMELKVDTSMSRSWDMELQKAKEALEKMKAQVPAIQNKTSRLEEEMNKFINNLPADCSMEVKSHQLFQGKDGVYLIKVPGLSTAVEVFCDMATSGGSWTVLQRRFDGSEDFSRSWLDYKKGFGNPQKEFWIGNDVMHYLTSKENYTLRIDLWDIYGNYRYAEYTQFHIADEKDNYKLSVDGYRGNASDSLDYHNDMSFSTEDKDNDASDSHCAQYYSSGFWYNHCQYVNINGKYKNGVTWYDIDGQEWVQLSKVEMKIRPSRITNNLLKNRDY